jgi:lipopolysaccharide export LptBFGC system permease protein LptF
MRSTGISLLRILRPVFGSRSPRSSRPLLLEEFVVPLARCERDQIYDQRIPGAAARSSR